MPDDALHLEGVQAQGAFYETSRDGAVDQSMGCANDHWR
jgi:hypothetical protein